MKTSIYKLFTVFSIAILFFANIAYSLPPEEFQKKIKKEFEINSDALLKLSSKYGSITCKNWEKNIISFEVTIEVEAANKEKSEEIFNNISIDFSGNKSVVEAKTVFNEKVFTLISNKNNKLNVNYDIYFPETISLELVHKYGAVFIEDVNGKVFLDVSYGSIQSGDIGANNNELRIGYCKASVEEFCGGNIDVKYSSFNMDECKNGNFNSKYSTITIGEADDLILDSGYDHFTIDEIKRMNVKSQFSEFDIGELKKRLEIDMSYGNFEVEDVSSEFEEIIIKNSYANVSLGISENASYLLNAELKYGSLKIPDNHKYLTKQIVSPSSAIYEGRIGNDKNTKSKVTINSKHAKVSLGE